MINAPRWMLILVIIIVAGATYYFLSRQEAPQQQPEILQPPPPPPAPSTEPAEPLTRHPVPEPTVEGEEPAKPLPTLEESDFAMQESISKLGDAKRLDELIIFNGFINRLVVTIDNLPRNKLPVQRLPTKPPLGKFLVKKEAGGAALIDPNNYQRYTRYVEFFEGLDSRKIAALYFHFYPLFQEAYRNLGYKTAYFNDRVIIAIDNLLATPQVQDPVILVQPSVFYKYANSSLEDLSIGQRLMIRIGSDNAARVKVKLKDLRNALTKRDTPH